MTNGNYNIMKENPGVLGPWGSLVSLELREFLTPVQIRTGPLMFIIWCLGLFISIRFFLKNNDIGVIVNIIYGNRRIKKSQSFVSP